MTIVVGTLAVGFVIYACFLFMLKYMEWSMDWFLEFLPTTGNRYLDIFLGYMFAIASIYLICQVITIAFEKYKGRR